MKLSLFVSNIYNQVKDKVREVSSFLASKIGQDKVKTQMIYKWGLFTFGVGCLLSTDFFGWLVDSGLILLGAAAVALAFAKEQPIITTDDDEFVEVELPEDLKQQLNDLLNEAYTNGTLNLKLDDSEVEDSDHDYSSDWDEYMTMRNLNQVDTEN